MSLFDKIGSNPEIRNSMKKNISSSFGFMSSSNDFTPAISATYNLMKAKFFDLFKELLNIHPMNAEEYKDEGDNFVYFSKFIYPACDKVNNKNYAPAFDIKGNDEYEELHPKFIDLLNGEDITRITNPTEDDLNPEIIIMPNTFLATDAVREVLTNNYHVEYPNSTIPLMVIHPSLKNTNKFKAIFENETNCISKDLVIGMRSNKPILEISHASIMAALTPLFNEVDPATKNISEVGVNKLSDIIDTYASVATALITINLREDPQQGLNLIPNLYSKFCNNYQNATVNQQYLFTIITKLFESVIGQKLLPFIADEKAVSSLDLLDKTSRRYDFFNSVLDNNNDDSCKFRQSIIYNINVACESLPEDSIADMSSYLNEQRSSYKEMVTRIINYTIDGVVGTINEGPNKCDVCGDVINLDEGFNKLNAMMLSIQSQIGDISSQHGVFSIMVMEFINANTSTARKLMIDSIEKAIFNNPNPTIIGNYSNLTWNNPSERTYTDDFLRKRYSALNGTASEDVNLELEVFHTKKSNAAMNAISEACKNITSFEDAMGIMVKADKYLDLASKSSLKEENADTIQFKTFMINAHNKTHNLLNDFIEG